MDVSYDLSSLVYSYLVISDANGKLVGDLATFVPSPANGGISRDGRTYVYHLRRGVLWHDGRPFTSRDVRASWHAVMNPRNLTVFRQGYDRVARIDTPDAWTAIVHLRERYPPFATQFFTPLQEGGKPLLPAHILEREADFNTGVLSARPVGTGPFRFVSWKRGDAIELARNERYFKGRPLLDRIELRFVPDDQTLWTEMRLHHLDLLIAPRSPLYGKYRAIAGVKTGLAPWNAQEVLVINVSKPGLNDVRVRRAMAASIDYGALVGKISHGAGEPAYDVLAPTAIGYERLPRYRYNVRAAMRMLESAGWRIAGDGIRARGGERLEFPIATIAGSADFTRAAIQIQANLRAAGISAPVRTYPYETMFSTAGPLYGRTFDLALYSTTLSWDPDAHVYYGCDQSYPRGANYFGYCNPAFDRYEREGLGSDDPASRARAYRGASRVLHDDVAYVPLFELRRPIVRSIDLQHFSVNPSATPWWNAWQWDI